MKIAIPTAGGKLCQHFGHCETFVFFEVDIDSRKILNKEEIVPPEHVPGILPPWVAEHGVTLVLAGGMGGHAQSLFNQIGIRVIAGCPSETPEKIALNFLEQTLVLGKNGCDHGPCEH